MRRTDLRFGDGFEVSSFFMKKAIFGLKTKFWFGIIENVKWFEIYVDIEALNRDYFSP